MVKIKNLVALIAIHIKNNTKQSKSIVINLFFIIFISIFESLQN